MDAARVAEWVEYGWWRKCDFIKTQGTWTPHFNRNPRQTYPLLGYIHIYTCVRRICVYYIWYAVLFGANKSTDRKPTSGPGHGTGHRETDKPHQQCDDGAVVTATMALEGFSGSRPPQNVNAPFQPLQRIRRTESVRHIHSCTQTKFTKHTQPKTFRQSNGSFVGYICQFS